MPHECCNIHRWHWYKGTKNTMLLPMNIYVVCTCSFKITLEIIKIESPTYLHFFVFIFLRRHWPRRTPRSTGIPRYVQKMQSHNVCSFRGIVFDTQCFCLPFFENEVKTSKYPKKGLLSSPLLRGDKFINLLPCTA